VFYIDEVGSGQELGQLIRRARGDRSQAWLSAQLINRGLNFDQGAVSKVERGLRDLEMPELVSFADALNLSWSSISQALGRDYERARASVGPGGRPIGSAPRKRRAAS